MLCRDWMEKSSAAVPGQRLSSEMEPALQEGEWLGWEERNS